MIANPFFWNNFTQRALSQSNNISYAARGVYRVHDTEPNRKGDYWFRDFGMVMACAYMTELGFRAAETLNTIPLLTQAMKLNQLSELKNPVTGKQLYHHARNYNALPEVVRERVMGTLIRNSSSLVPNLMKELELRHEGAGKLPVKVRNMAREMLESPIADAESKIKVFLQETGLKLADIRAISKIENRTRREEAIVALHQRHAKLKVDTIQHAVRLEDARQMGILIDHLHKNLNFPEYLKDNYLAGHQLSGSISDVIREYADKLDNMREKGKKEFGEAIAETLKLPPEIRGKAFDKRFNDILGSLELKKGVLLATEAEHHALRELASQTRAALKSDDHKALKDIKERVSAYYTNLKAAHNDHLDNLWANVGDDLRAKLTKQIEAAVEAVQTDSSGRETTKVLKEKLDALNLDKLTTSSKPVAVLKEKLEACLPKTAGQHIPADSLKQASGLIREFMAQVPQTVDELLTPLLKKAPVKEEFQRLIMDGLHSKTMSAAISRIQGNGTWPKMAATVLLNLFFYGFLASNFDNKILQPFQKKLVAERGTSQDIVTAGYLGLIPGFAMLTQLWDKTSLAVFRRMGHFTRFAVVGGAALAAFAGSTYAILMQRLKTLPTNPPKAPIQPSNPFYQAGGTTLHNTPHSPMAYAARSPSPFQPHPSLTLANGSSGFALGQAPNYKHPYGYGQ